MSSTNSSSKGLINGPVDQFGRYKIVSDLIKELVTIKQQKNVKILDIGGYKGLTSKFFEKDVYSVSIVDLFKSNDKNYTQASALALPFENNTFDYAVSFEVLEHIPRKDRELYISEALRVSKGALILTAPFAGKNNIVKDTEVLVNDVWKEIHGSEHRWLKEHIDNIIPSNDEVETIFKKYKQPFKKMGNNDIQLWNQMVSFNFLTTLFRGSGDNPNVQRYYNENLAILENDAEFYYRYIYIVGKDANLDPKITNSEYVEASVKTKKEIELTNLMFKSIAKDVLDLIKTRDKEIKKLSKELEKRIKLYDDLVKDTQQFNLERSKAKHKLISQAKTTLSSLKKSVTK